MALKVYTQPIANIFQVGDLIQFTYRDMQGIVSKRLGLCARNKRTGGGCLYKSKKSGKKLLVITELVGTTPTKDLVLLMHDQGILGSPDVKYGNEDLVAQYSKRPTQYRHMFFSEISSVQKFVVLDAGNELK